MTYKLREVFPTLARALELDLRQTGYRDLAEQVADLEITDRCRCDSTQCGTFFCVSERKRSYSRIDHTIMLNSGNVDVAGRIIVSVETLSPEVNAVLVGLFP